MELGKNFAVSQPQSVVRVHRFAMVSGLGWCMDLLIMSTLVWGGVQTFGANIVSAGLAITFVFLVSQKRIFLHDGHLIGRRFFYYCLWQLVAVPLASLLIAELVPLIGRSPILPLTHMLLPGKEKVLLSVLSKGMVTPVTLYANYLFMTWLLERRLSWK